MDAENCKQWLLMKSKGFNTAWGQETTQAIYQWKQPPIAPEHSNGDSAHTCIKDVAHAR